MNISSLSNDEKILELLIDVDRKYNTFSIGNTLFPKNKISDNELLLFFKSFVEYIDYIAYTPEAIVNGKSLKTIKICACNISTLAENVKYHIKEESSISFYDINFEIEMNRYCCRMFIYDNPIKVKAINRDSKIDKVLNDK